MLCSVLRRTVRLPLLSGVSTQSRLATGFGGSSIYDSKVVGPPELYTEVEKSYAEWKFVEKLLPPEFVPLPPADPKVEYPSGWRPPHPSPDAPYIIPRTKNHMPPVYLKIEKKQGGTRRITRIRYVEGNIWALEKDVGEYLKEKYPGKQIVTWVHESFRHVNIVGEYEEDVREWMLENGF